MATLKFQNIGIHALSSCVPAQVVNNADDLRELLPADELKKVIDAIGIKTRHICGNACNADDLCQKAAQNLFAQTQIAPESIDVLLYISQSNHQRIPATATILQHQLGLPTSCAALDLSLACSGYIFALATAFSFVNAGAKRVLLLCGDAISQFVEPDDRVNKPLYGDAGTATIIEAGDYGNAIFDLNTDGSGRNAVKTLPNDKIFMDGMEVFNFAIKRVPAVVKAVCDAPANLDWLVFHQANKMMTDFLAARIRVPAEKVPYSLDKFGNTSAPSIPLTISEKLADVSPRECVLLCGFGAGFSWGAAQLSLSKTTILKPIIF